MTLRWKKHAPETGLRSIGARPRGYDLRLDGEEVATVYPNGGGWQRKQEGWYWVVSDLGWAPYCNTCKTPVATAEEAKAEAMAYIKKHLWRK